MTKDVMIDIETLGTDRNALILSIGACDVWNTAENFYSELSVESQPGRVVEISTLKFWLKEGNIPINGTRTLATALYNLYDWIVRVRDSEELKIWCKGTDFDTAILAHAYKAMHQTAPWKYNSTRDFRTLMKHFPTIPAPEFVGRKHNALDDAIHQADHLRLILS